MIRGLLAYAVTLLCGGLFYLFYPGYLSFYALVLLLALPLLSLLLALPGRRRLALSAVGEPTSVSRGEAGLLRVILSGPAGTQVRLTYRVEDLLHPGSAVQRSVRLYADLPLELPLPAEHCGWVKLTLLRCRVPGWLGILSLPLPLPEPVFVLVRPHGGEIPQGLDLAPVSPLPLRPRPGGGPGEEYELRPYRPGDPVSAIHWKLTAKQPTEEPILRQTLEPVEPVVAVGYDHLGPPARLDAVMDQLQGLATRLTEQAIPFTLCWTDPFTGAVTLFDICCPRAWEDCYRAIAAKPAPLAGKTSPTPPPRLSGVGSPVKWIYLTGEGVASP